MQRTLFTEDHESFRETIRGFLAKEVVPYYSEWERNGMVPRDLYRRLGEIGYFGIEVPEECGGAGISSYKYQAVVAEEVARAGVSLGAAGAHLLLGLPYLLKFGSDEQRHRWMPGFMSGDIVTALAMTEPGTGSDLAGIRTTATLSADGTHYVVNGAKTFISGGFQADLIVVVCRTSAATAEDRRAGLSLLCVDTKSAGFEVGRVLDKIGMRTSDTAELSFTDVAVPVENLLGEEGRAFDYLTRNLVQERLGCAYTSFAQASAAVAFTTDYVRERKVFGKSLAGFQNTKFVLAECATEVEAAQTMVDKAVDLFDAGALTAVDAAKVKLFCTEVAGRVIDKCLQLHGGYGYMLEYPIARLYTDTRVSRIFAGSSEVMKTIIAKDLGL